MLQNPSAKFRKMAEILHNKLDKSREMKIGERKNIYDARAEVKSLFKKSEIYF